jgi:glycosyltransferase involved in cell wall biosynthesis
MPPAKVPETRILRESIRASREAEVLRVQVLEPWLEGSHAAFLSGWQARSAHRVEICGLPGRHWKWHSRVASWDLPRHLRDNRAEVPELLFASDYLDVAATIGNLPAAWRDRPWILYFHENQLTYPSGVSRQESERDLTWAFQNLFACLAAQRVVFNSRFHRSELTRAADELLARMPPPCPRAEVAEALARARVIGPGIEMEVFPLGRGAPQGAPLRVLFNHRREHDKDPVACLEALLRARRAGARLELVLLGQRFDKAPSGLDSLLAEGATGLVNVVYVTAATGFGTTSPRTATASCGPGTVVVGGGFEVNAGAGFTAASWEKGAQIANKPTPGNAWEVTYTNSDAGATWSITAFAVCAVQ